MLKGEKYYLQEVNTMARPHKENLDYFPLDTDFFSDRKIKRLQTKFGAVGVSVYLYIICEIYKNGYSLLCDDDLICDISGFFVIEEEKAAEMVSYMVSRSLLVSIEAEDGVFLASRSQQLRYQEAKREAGRKRCINIDKKFWLLTDEETYDFITFINCGASNDAGKRRTDKRSSAPKNGTDKNSAPDYSTDNNTSIREYEEIYHNSVHTDNYSGKNEGYSGNNSLKESKENKSKEIKVNVCKAEESKPNESTANESKPNESKSNESKSNESKSNESKSNISKGEETKAAGRPEKKQVIVMRLPCRDGFFELTKDIYDELTHKYNKLNIDLSLDKMRSYLIANPQKQGTKNTVIGYINMWLRDDTAAGHNLKPYSYEPAYDIDEYESTGMLDESYDDLS